MRRKWLDSRWQRGKIAGIWTRLSVLVRTFSDSEAVPVPAGRPSLVPGLMRRHRQSESSASSHPEIYGTALCASPGAGYRPPAVLPCSVPRVYLVAGTSEPFFRDNATRWADALRDVGADVVMVKRAGSHGDPFWRHGLPLMATWAFRP